MRLRRKEQPAAEPVAEATPPAEVLAAGRGPFDYDELGLEADDPDVSLIDLGGLLLPPPPEGVDLQIQVDEQSGQVMAVLLAAEDGAMELRAFAVGRSASLWDEVRQSFAADSTRRGGTVSFSESRFGPEVQCQVPVQTPDGQSGMQPTRVVGIDGSRWFLRAVMLGLPAVQSSAAQPFEEVLQRVVVRRGHDAMPQGEALPLHLPAGIEEGEHDG